MSLDQRTNIFARLELEKKRKIREEANANQEAAALKDRKDRHHNN